jgi:hypothetical protein
MANSKINGLTALTDPEVNDPTRLFPLADATSGIAGSATVAQLKALATVSKVKYVATGSEGTVITIGALAAKTILLVTREASILHEVISPTVPDTGEFTFDSTNINLGLAVTGAGERFTILYRS